MPDDGNYAQVYTLLGYMTVGLLCNSVQYNSCVWALAKARFREQQQGAFQQCHRLLMRMPQAADKAANTKAADEKAVDENATGC